MSLTTGRFAPSEVELGLNRNLGIVTLSMMNLFRQICEVQSDSGRSMCIEKKVAGRVSECHCSFTSDLLRSRMYWGRWHHSVRSAAIEQPPGADS